MVFNVLIQLGKKQLKIKAGGRRSQEFRSSGVQEEERRRKKKEIGRKKKEENHLFPH
jgi:hypothetical protein